MKQNRSLLFSFCWHWCRA